jgi:hypothetical protein
MDPPFGDYFFQKIGIFTEEILGFWGSFLPINEVFFGRNNQLTEAISSKKPPDLWKKKSNITDHDFD